MQHAFIHDEIAKNASNAGFKIKDVCDADKDRAYYILEVTD